MPKKQKTHPMSNSKSQRKNKQKETHSRAQQKPVSIFKSKYYWISLAATILVFTFVLGYVLQMSEEKELLMLGSVFSVIGLAFYIGYKPSVNYDKRATFFFVGAAVIGFGIWALIVLFLNAFGILVQIPSLIGDSFFVITSQIICLVLGAFIGDFIGKNREAVLFFAHKFRNRLFYSGADNK
jgi:cation transport ATPase